MVDPSDGGRVESEFICKIVKYNNIESISIDKVLESTINSKVGRLTTRSASYRRYGGTDRVCGFTLPPPEVGDLISI